MANINDNYTKLQAGYLFPEIGRRVSEFATLNPNADIIRLGIGDVTLPLAPAIVEAVQKATIELGSPEGFRGYGPEQGYDFLLNTISENDYKNRNIEIEPEEIFVSDGSKQDSGNIQEIFDANCKICVTDPVYPVYVDTNVMAGRSGQSDSQGRYEGITYLSATEENKFSPVPPSERADLAYLCSPNNPTGAVMDHEALEAWVKWAISNEAVLIFDAAYDAFITDPSLPRSIFEIEGARDCAIEMRSFSKRSGFTGLRCAYTAIPKEVFGSRLDGSKVALGDLWSRRHSTKFNSVPYIVQRAAEATFSKAGQKQTQDQVKYYMENARILREGLSNAGFGIFGGVHAPYIWMQTPEGLSSWDFFDRLLSQTHVVGTPGAGFGASGEGYLRLSAFNSRNNVNEAVSRIENNF